MRAAGYIKEIYLIPEFRYQKIGTSVLKYIHETFRALNVKTAKLLVSDTNKDALNFYTKMGYTYKKILLERIL